MADKRKLLLEVDVDVDSKPLKQLGDDAGKAEHDFEDLNKGLKKLDDAFDETKKRAADLRAEISKSGDVGLIKDLQKAERELKRIERDRKTVRGDDGGLPDLIPKLDLPKVTKAGATAGTAFAEGLFGQVSAVGKSPAALGVIAGLGAALTPAIGASVAAGIIGGAGVGGVVGGIALAKKDPRVQRELEDLSSIAGSQLRLAASPFVDETLDGIKTIRHALADSDDDFRRLFASAAKNVAPLTKGITQGAKSLLSGVADVAESSGPAVRELSAGFAELGDTIGDGLRQLSDNGPEAASAMRNIFAILNLTTGAALGTVNALTELYGKLELGTAILRDDRETIARYVAAQGEIAASEKQAREESGSLALAFRETGAGARFAAAGADALKQSLDELINDQLSLDQANLAVKQGFANLNAELKNGKRTLNENSQAGRDNRAGILDQIGTLERQREKQIEVDGVTDGANKRFKEGVAAIEANAVKLGFNKQEVQKLVAAYKNIPGDVSTDVNANTRAATTTINNFITKLKNLDGTTAVTYVKTVDLGGGSYRASSSGGGGRSIEPRAGGGSVMAGQTYLVGEQGKELFTPTTNGYVHDAKATAAMARSSSAAGWGGDNHYHLTVINHGPVANRMQFESMVEVAFNNLARKGKVDSPRR